MSDLRVSLVLDGSPVDVTCSPSESLLDVIRDRLQCFGQKEACGEGECGACTVLVDDDAQCACLVPAVGAAGASITTIHGLADDPIAATVVEALVTEGAVQCGFCTPGIVVTLRQLLVHDELEMEAVTSALVGHLCRCTGYGRILAAVAALGDST